MYWSGGIQPFDPPPPSTMATPVEGRPLTRNKKFLRRRQLQQLYEFPAWHKAEHPFLLVNRAFHLQRCLFYAIFIQVDYTFLSATCIACSFCFI
jgi:hypothetical protein